MDPNNETTEARKEPQARQSVLARQYERRVERLTRTAVWLALGAFAIGVAASILWNEPALVSRFATLIIVVGVVTSYIKIVRMENFRYSIDVMMGALAATRPYRFIKIQRKSPSLTPEQVAEQLARNEKEIADDANAGFSRAERRFWLTELAILCIGTLLNGFGDLLIIGATRTFRWLFL